MALSAFEVGFLIGTYANKQWLHVGIPQSPDTSGPPIYYFTNNRAAGFSQDISGPDSGVGYPPDAMFRWLTDVKSRETGRCVHCPYTITNPSNPNYWPDVPSPFQSRPRQVGDSWKVGYLTIAQVLDAGPKDYAGEPYGYQVESPPDPGVDAVRDKTRTLLESGRFPELRATIEFELGTGDACDPAEPFVCNVPAANPSTRERQRRCDLRDGGTGADPDPTRPITVNHPALYDMHQVLLRRDEGADPTTPLVEVELRKGWTRAHVTKEWAGWGWRHIQAKHGWSPDDTVATQQALQFPPVRQPNGALRYVGATYVQNGEGCARVVIVRDRVRSGEPMPAGIITSYGELIP